MKLSQPDANAQPLSDEEALKVFKETHWYQSWELRPGMVTPGLAHNPSGQCDMLHIPKDLTGMKCLDIGPMDGPMTFEMERRGAHAMALDIQDPTQVGFDSARRIMGAKAAHYQGSVYGLPHAEMNDLDLVVFCGVYYHLKYPIMAFERISAAMKLGGTLHFEGAGLVNYAEDIDGQPSGLSPEYVGQWNDKRVPVCISYPNHYLGASNWFVPNAACLEGWLKVSGFEVREILPFTDGGAQRLYGHAVKVSHLSEQVEHPAMGTGNPHLQAPTS